jgi:hypothetical protein
MDSQSGRESSLICNTAQVTREKIRYTVYITAFRAKEREHGTVYHVTKILFVFR